MSILGHLTGRIQFRQSWDRRMVLTVEYYFTSAHTRGPHCGSPYPVYRWRDAGAIDLADLVAMGVLPSSDKSRTRDFESVGRAA